MVSLSLMVRLVDAVRPGARLVLVGDPGQLASVEAGAVLADVAGPAADAPRMRAAAAAQLSRVSAMDVAPDAGGTAIGDGIVTLGRVHRFGAEIGAVAAAIRAGDPAATLAALAGGGDAVTWLPPEAATELVRSRAVGAARAVIAAAREGDAHAALARAHAASACSARTAAGRTASRPGARASRRGSPRPCPASPPGARGTPGARCSSRRTTRRSGSSTATRA